jgi:hypothetical protein
MKFLLAVLIVFPIVLSGCVSTEQLATLQNQTASAGGYYNCYFDQRSPGTPYLYCLTIISQKCIVFRFMENGVLAGQFKMCPPYKENIVVPISVIPNPGQDFGHCMVSINGYVECPWANYTLDVRWD